MSEHERTSGDGEEIVNRGLRDWYILKVLRMIPEMRQPINDQQLSKILARAPPQNAFPMSVEIYTVPPQEGTPSMPANITDYPEVPIDPGQPILPSALKPAIIGPEQQPFKGVIGGPAPPPDLAALPAAGQPIPESGGKVYVPIGPPI